MERQHVSRAQLRRLLPDDGAAGWTSYAVPRTVPEFGDEITDAEIQDEIAAMARESATGCVLFAQPADARLVVPPFAVEQAECWNEMRTGSLIEVVERARTVAAFLLRRGGFTMGVFRGESLVDSKTDRRFVKNRHRKGGQSQRRFDRIREKQIHELFGKACTELREKFGPYEDEIQHVLLGGDRLGLGAFRKECTYLDRFGERLMSRILPVAGDPRRESLDVLPREIWASEVYLFPLGTDDRADGGPR